MAHLNCRNGIIEKKIFGGIGFLQDGNIVGGCNKQDLTVGLRDTDFQKAVREPRVRGFDMCDRRMKAWIRVLPQGCASDKVLLGWPEKGITLASSLPSK